MRQHDSHNNSVLLPSRNLIHSTIFAASHSHRPSVLYAATPVAAPHPSLFDILPIFFNPTKVHNKLSNAVQSFQQPCTVVTCDDRTHKNIFCCNTKDYQLTTAVATNRASRIQSQIYLNFAEAMPIDGRAQVATLQPHITAAYNFHDFPYFPAFPHFPKNSPFPPFPVKPINQETIPTPR